MIADTLAAPEGTPVVNDESQRNGRRDVDIEAKAGSTSSDIAQGHLLAPFLPAGLGRG